MIRKSVALLIASLLVTSCGTVKEKTAPCKRPANLTSYTHDPRAKCPTMMSVNEPGAAFVAIGIVE
ncbi:hypothetical protein KX729_30530 [Rhizobium sp. XQZ8]|uniref:hypothetical protein n=1 Tax=Rhizobium populisoli TaxID=2859785 RepID=UPI001CA47E13|nr:hypothetical protein [Rhizobium populisoli]MBW6425731.1 hypothetical protein [Rhizobium populisoli]